ncbi:hypothetical protein [Priestia megaterium]|uniref:hypothetical protein n=1 Tax=Priestia megaterium TaxID=1404 RepID=UPI001E4EC975|nr:hypothetical protein [Priestia megaterium]
MRPRRSVSDEETHRPPARGKPSLARKSTAAEQEVQIMYANCSSLDWIDVVMSQSSFI